MINIISIFSLSFISYFAKSNTGLDPLSCTILDSSVFDNFILADEVFSKALQSIETCPSVNNNLCGKLFLSLESPVTFFEKFQGYFIPDFSLLSCEINYLTFEPLFWVSLY